MSIRVNMAAVAAKMAVADAEDREGLVYDAGELRSYDLQSTPSKAQQRIWNAQKIDATTIKTQTQTTYPYEASSPTNNLHSRMAEAKRKMLALRTEVLDALDVQSAQREDTRIRLRAIRDGSARHNSETIDIISTFDNGYVHLDSTGHDIPKVLDAANTELRMPFFESFGLPIRIPNDEVIASYLQLVSSRLLSEDEGAQFCHNFRKDATSVLFPCDDKKIPELLCSVNRFTKTDVIKAVLEALGKYERSLEGLDADIAQVESEIEVLLTKEQFAEAEKKMSTLLSLSGKRTDIKAIQLAILAGSGNEGAKSSSTPAAAGFLKALDHLLHDSAIPTLRVENDAHIASARGDIGRLAATHAVRLKENEMSIARYNLWVHDSKQRLGNNHKKQLSIWEKVLSLMDDLEEVGKEHEALVHEHVRVTEVEQIRRQDHREYLDSYRKHTVSLEDLIRNAEVGLTFLDTLNAKFQQARADLERSGIEARLQELLESYRKDYLQAFGHYGSNSNQHIARYDQRAASHEHMYKELEFAQQQAPLLGDADKNMYSRRYHELDRQRRAALDKAIDLANEYQVRENYFIDIAANVQEALRTKGDVVLLKQSLADTSDEGELLATLRGARAAANEGHLNRITAVAKRNQASLEALRQHQSDIESRQATNSPMKANH